MIPDSVDNDNLLALIENLEVAYDNQVDCHIGYEVLPYLIDALYKTANFENVGTTQWTLEFGPST